MKRIVLAFAVTFGLGSALWGVGGCGGSSSGAEGGEFDGTWSLVVNGCQDTYDFAEQITLTLTDSVPATSDGGVASDIYSVDAPAGFEDNNIVAQSDGAAAMCLSPAGELAAADCNILCSGTINGDEFSGNCEISPGGDLCGPVTYSKD